MFASPEKLKDFFFGSRLLYLSVFLAKSLRISPNEPARMRLSTTKVEIYFGEFKLFGVPARPKASVNCCRQPHERKDLDN